MRYSPNSALILKATALITSHWGGFQPDLEGSGMVDNNRIVLRDLKIGVRGSTITLAGEVLNYLRGTPSPMSGLWPHILNCQILC